MEVQGKETKGGGRRGRLLFRERQEDGAGRAKKGSEKNWGRKEYCVRCVKLTGSRKEKNRALFRGEERKGRWGPYGRDEPAVPSQRPLNKVEDRSGPSSCKQASKIRRAKSSQEETGGKREEDDLRSRRES